jgi:4-carboxymuconolactone decarboxylase
MAALIASRAWTQQFEWDVHILQALDAGMTVDVANAIAEGRRPAKMTEDEAVLYDFVTEVLATKGASDTTYAATVAKFGEQGVVDILGIVGYYATLAMIMNVARTPLLEGRPHPIVPLPVQLGQLEGSPTRGRK